MRAVLLVLGCAACGHLGFDELPPLEPPAHVPGGTPLGGTGTLVLGDAVIDTSALTIDGGPPAHGQLVAIAQPGAATGLALLQADHLVVEGTVSVRGARGLILLARTIDITGLLDASARGPTPGPGAVATNAGAGVHSPGDVCDSGGGGGGHGTAGAAGGDAGGCTTGGRGGGVLGDDVLTLLVGGAGGADGVTGACGIPSGGGGGGALQLSAQERLRITGAVFAGGGGGAGGLECGDGDAGAGGGGGAGGAIYLEAAAIVIDGVVTAHGGGGGGGGNGLTENGPVGPGGAGADAASSELATGGAPAAPNAGAGGDGGTGASVPGAGRTAEHNAGGGGGAAGRIVITGSTLSGTGLISPRAP